MEGTEEVAGGLVVTSGNAAILLELVEKLLNQVTCLVQVLVVLTGLSAAALGRNDNAFACLVQRIDEPLLGIVSLVGNDGGSRRVSQQSISAFEVVGLPRCQVKSGRIAQSIDGGMNFRAQPTAAASDCFAFSPPFFAPALC